MLTLMLLTLGLGRLTANGRAGWRAGRFGPCPGPRGDAQKNLPS